MRLSIPAIYIRVNGLVMLSVTMRQRHGLLIRRVPSILIINWVTINGVISTTLRDMMMPRVAKLIGVPSWCNLAAIFGRCKSQLIGANIAIRLSMGRWMMNYFRILNGVIVRVRPYACVISAR